MPAPTNEPRETLSRASLLRISAALLVASAILLAAAVSMAAYIIWDKHQMASLKGSLLAQQQLQQALLAGQASDHATFPHLDPGISFVLNPGMDEVTWHTRPDAPYRVNTIGLRGPEIAPTAEGVKRIALVGDSVLFGWKLREQEKLASLLQDITDQRLGAGKYEFVTIALPGWNTVDQDRFLRSHLGRIDPDYIIWSIIRNDLLDSAGVVPPGVLMSWNSPQKAQQQPFQFLPPAELRDSPAPAIMQRWRSNLRRIDTFGREHAIPISLLWWRDRQRPLFDYVRSQLPVDLPVVFLPGYFRYDEDNWCVDYPDCHPTLWANQRLALGLLDELIKRGVIEPLAWSEQEQVILDVFAAASLTTSSSAEQRAFMQEQALRVNDRYSPDGGGTVLFGVHQGRMGKNGMLLLRQPGNELTLHMTITTGTQRAGPEQSIDISVHQAGGEITEKTISLPNGESKVSLPLNGGADFDLYQVQWRFAYAECRSPTACFSAELLDARLQSVTAEAQ